MDQNLTGVIAADITLYQPLYALIIIALVGPASAFISALAVLYATRRSQKHEELMAFHDIAKAERQKRRDLFAQLHSKKKRLVRLYFTRDEAKVNSSYYFNASKILEGQKGPKEDVDLNIEEQKYWVRRANDLGDLLSLEEERFFKIIGLISVSFPDPEDLSKLIDLINGTITLIPPDEPNFENLNDLDSWKKNTLYTLDAKVKNEYLQLIDDLMDFLKPYLKNEPMKESKTNGWWQFWK